MPDRRSSFPTESRVYRHRLRLALLVVIALLVSACGGDNGDDREDDRQFANDPTKPPTATAEVTQAPTDPEVTPTSQPSPEALLSARGGALLTWTLIGDRIVQIDPARAGQPPLEIAPEAGNTFLGLDAAPSGIRIAVLVLDPNGGIWLELYDSTGARQASWETGFGNSAGEGTPVPIDVQEPFVDWGGDGSRIIVGAGSVLKSFAMDGAATDISINPASGTVLHASWSPTSDTVALLLSRDGGTVVSLFRPGDPASRPSQVVPTGNSLENVTSFTWIPDGSGLIYLQQGRDGNQLYRYDVKREKAVVVATPGQGGPSAVISQFTVSPDGGSVAYVVKNLDDGRYQFHSFWIRSLVTGQTYQVPTGYPRDVNAFWWTRGGFLWGQLNQGEDGSLGESFVILAPGTQPTSVVDVLIRSGTGATPGASPIATPGT